MRHIFTEEQFAVLLAAAGVGEIYMFPIRQDAGDAELLGAVAGLLRLGVLTERGGRIVPGDYFAGLVRDMESAPRAVKLEFSGDFPQQLIYPADRYEAVILERDDRAGGTVVKVQRVDSFEYICELVGNEMLPEDLVAGKEDIKAIEAMAMEELQPKYNGEDLLMKIRRINTRTGDIEKKIDVFSSGIFKWFRICGMGEDSFHLYSAEELSKILLRELRR